MSNDFEKFNKKVQEMVQSTKGLSGLTVEVGLPDDVIHNPSGLPLSQLGAIHEFGLGNVPERSFLRGAVLNSREEIKSNFEIVAQSVINGADPMTAMEKLALFGQGLVQEYISDGIDPPNSEETIEGKDGKETPLINTGEMRQNIIGIVVSD